MKKSIGFLFLLIMVISARKKDKITQTVNSTPNIITTKNGSESTIPVIAESMTVLGNQLQNPFSVENMQTAFDQLAGNSQTTLQTTNLYVRFKPADIAEVKQLEDLGLDLWDTPFDYEVVSYGEYYHDPSIPEEDYTYFYTVVDPNFQFPSGIEYTVLDDCFYRSMLLKGASPT